MVDISFHRWNADRKLVYLVSYLCHLTPRKSFRIYHFSFFDWILITLILMRVKSASMIVDLFLSSLLTILTEMHFHPLIWSVFRCVQLILKFLGSMPYCHWSKGFPYNHKIHILLLFLPKSGIQRIKCSIRISIPFLYAI